MSRRLRTILTCGLILLVWSMSISAIAQETLSARAQKVVDEAVAREMERQKAVGVAVGVIRNGRVASVKGYGFEDRELKIPVTSHTMFRWASISKTLTAITAMQLVEQGQLSLDTDVRSLVPEFPDKGDVITVRDLLCHQSGIVHYANGPVIRTQREYDSEHPFENVVLALDTFKESPLVNHPREKFSYSTHAYILLSAVVERAGKQPFAKQVQKRIAVPLELSTLQPDYQWKTIEHRAVGYRLRGGAVVSSTDTDVSWKLGGGGYISTVDDLAAFAAGIIRGELLEEATWDQVCTAQVTADGVATPLGLGFFIEGERDGLRVSHDGSQEKCKTRMVTYPRQRHGVVVMSNSENVNPGNITTAIYAALDQVPAK